MLLKLQLLNVDIICCCHGSLCAYKCKIEHTKHADERQADKKKTDIEVYSGLIRKAVSVYSTLFHVDEKHWQNSFFKADERQGQYCLFLADER
jgi:hypothetical protein